MPDIEIYWVGAAVWLVGFFAWLVGTYWRPSVYMSRVGTILCWIGFLGTMWPHLKAYDGPPFEWPTSFDPRSLTPAMIYSLIRVAWILGFSLLFISLIGLLRPIIGWAGFVIGTTAVVISWAKEPSFQLAALGAGALLLLTLFGSARVSRNRSTRPGDYVAELVLLCHGDRAQVERLIAYELKRHPGFSRQGAAMAAVEKLVRDRGGM